jgi:hypothetical protein
MNRKPEVRRPKSFRMAVVLGLALVAMLFAASAAYALPVIPNAAGYGIDTPAGRGGTIYKVTSLANTNTPGTLRYALSQTGPRIIVFEVAGTIEVNDYLDIRNPYVTVAGQTAPSPGIFLKGATIRILTHDVLLQHLRVAPGDDPSGVVSYNRDALSINGVNGKVENVVIDHCTFTWSVDEIIELWNAYDNITLRHVIASEPLHDSIHVDPGQTEPEPHGFGPIYDNQANSRLAVIGSLFSHAEGRQPYSMASQYVQVNNVFYDRVNTFNRLGSQKGVATLNTIAGNLYVNGPSIASWAVNKKPIELMSDFASGGKLYVSDNAAPDYTVSTPWDLVDNNSSLTQAQVQATTPPASVPGLTVLPSSQVKDWVLDNAGARPADRLPYENRIVGNARSGTGGGIVDSIAEAGGWPTVPYSYRPLDVPENPGGDDDADGYTNVEEWLEAYAAFVEGRGPDPYPSPIANLTVNDTANAADWSVQSNLQEGDLSYGDRTTTFSAIDFSVAGSNWIRPAQDSKAYTGSTLVSFTVKTDADVYVAHNDAITTKPSWLSTWTDTGKEIAGNGLTYSLYKKTFTAGSTVSLGNNGHTSYAQYIVAVRPLAPVISDLAVYDTARMANWTVQQNLQTGDLSYGDRTVVFSSVPASVAGSDWIRPAMDSKAFTGSTLVSFKVNSAVNVYVAHNDAITTKPSWLSSWTDTGEDITGNGLTYSLYRKSFAAGSTVTLGANGHTSYAQYLIAVK